MGKEVLSPPLFSILMWTMCVFQQGMAQTQASPTAQLSHGEIVQLQAKAQAGDPNAQVNLGRAYEDGDGVPQSDQLAVKWYWAAAERGNAIAQNNLGLMIRSGRGVEQDKQEAVGRYRKAAKQKNPSAMFNLGTAYYNGDGIGIDDTSAFAWFLLAQALGNKPAGEAVNRMIRRSKESSDWRLRKDWRHV
jgi:TPR repeat protein